MIYLFASRRISPTSIIISNYLSFKLNIKNKIITDFESVDKKNDIILPIGINACKTCYDAKILNALVSSPKMYDLLNNKESCSKFVNELHIPIIDTFSFEEMTSDINLNIFLNKYSDNQVFILKELETAGSNGMIVANKNRILNENFNKEEGINLSNYILQPYLDNNQLYSFNVVCNDGVILNSLLIKQDTLFNRDRLLKKNHLNSERHIIDESDKNYEQILFYSSQILSKVNFNGICEIEFLYNSTNDKILFLEINPRISGHFLLVFENKLLYIEELISSYIIFLQNNLDDKDVSPNSKYNYLHNNKFIQNNYYIKSNANLNKRGRNARAMIKSIVLIILLILLLFLVGRIFLKGLRKV
jgi:hypothetical protein